MIKPSPLKPGDKVGIVATARRIRREDIDAAVETLERWGLKVELSPYLFSDGHSYLAGSDEQRHAALQQFVDDSSIRAILCARGGYGTTRIIDEINWDELKKNPRWVVGFSDITALHLRLATLGIQSIHGTMPALFKNDDATSSVESLQQVLWGNPEILKAPASFHNRTGVGEGILVGGNLSLVVDSLGTRHEVDTHGRILILEEVDEYLYRIDRMIVQLKRAGKLEGLAGLAIGHFSEIKDTELPFGESFEEIIRYHTKDFNYPVGFHFPVGHINPNVAWRSGAMATLEVTADGSSIRTLN
jgi:Uncharacterized proteins, homologs of microcin C7 resistance protein MccF